MQIAHSLRVPHGTFLLSSLLLLCAPLYAKPTEQGTPALITMASDNVEAKEQVQHGIRDLLMGWDEMARYHFRAAVEGDSTCALAWCGLMQTEGVTSEARDALEKILTNGASLTPQEEALLNTWLQVIAGDWHGAGEAFVQRAEQYRNDKLSACWAIYLLHDGYDEVSGKAFPNQQKALEIAQQLYENHPEDSLVCYLRGWVESPAPEVSDEALKAAKNAFPGHPSTQLLLGHLYFRKGEFKESINSFKEAEKLVQNVPHGTKELPYTSLQVHTKLYLSTVLWMMGEKRLSLLEQSQLLKWAEQSNPSDCSSRAAVLLHWEARTLPLRLLMLSPELPSDRQILAAVSAATAKVARKDDPMLALRDCLRFCLAARQRAAVGKQAEALKCIKAAEASFQRLDVSRGTCAWQGDYVLSAWTRAREACQMAILAAKAATYPDTADIWLRSLEDSQKVSSMLMPPVLPHKNTKRHTK